MAKVGACLLALKGSPGLPMQALAMGEETDLVFESLPFWSKGSPSVHLSATCLLGLGKEWHLVPWCCPLFITIPVPLLRR